MGIACVWDAWKKNILDDLHYGFAVITIPAPDPFREIGIDRIPLVLNPRIFNAWLNYDTELTNISRLLGHVPEDLLNAYQISEEILISTENNKALIKPIGEIVISKPKKPIWQANLEPEDGKLSLEVKRIKNKTHDFRH